MKTKNKVGRPPAGTEEFTVRLDSEQLSKVDKSLLRAKTKELLKRLSLKK